MQQQIETLFLHLGGYDDMRYGFGIRRLLFMHYEVDSLASTSKRGTLRPKIWSPKYNGY